MITGGSNISLAWRVLVSFHKSPAPTSTMPKTKILICALVMISATIYALYNKMHRDQIKASVGEAIAGEAAVREDIEHDISSRLTKLNTYKEDRTNGMAYMLVNRDMLKDLYRELREKKERCGLGTNEKNLYKSVKELFKGDRRMPEVLYDGEIDIVVSFKRNSIRSWCLAGLFLYC
jgi:CRISPR/Cas system-associated protein Cas7 (RAMP superfamily)